MIEQGQFGSDLALVERAHLARLALWALASMLAGSTLIVSLRAAARTSPLLRAFAAVTLAFGAVTLPVAWLARRAVRVRDFGGAVALDQRSWLTIGLAIGALAVGVTLVVVGARLGRRLGLVGGGIAVALQGAALLLLHLQLSAAILR